MILHCHNCKNKFTIFDDESNLEGKLIKCQKCNSEWIYETKSQYLEKRLSELDDDLIKTELKINEKNTDHNEKVALLEKNLKIKKEELSKQIILEERITNFEKRITNTEKANAQQADLEIKIAQIENEVEKTTKNILNKNFDIEKKTNYLEMKINSYNNNSHKEKKIENGDIRVNESEVLKFRSIEKEEKIDKKDSSDDGKKDKKYRFFWPNKNK